MMKKITFLSAFILCSFLFSFGQITTVPEFPTDLDEVALTFDATGTPLQGYSGNLYTHTGVILEGSTNWSHVIGEWGDNSVQPQLTGIGNNKWELLISPSVRSFYGVNPNNIIRKMAFVFRSADGGTQSTDLFVDVFEAGLSIIISKPDSERVMVIENDILPVIATSPLADSMFLYINNQLEYAVEGIQLEYDIFTENIVGYWEDIPVEIVAINEDDTASASFIYFVIPAPEIAELPEGIIDGINYLDDHTVVLSLCAPFSSFVFVMGDFNEWEYNEDHFMHKTPDGERFWLQIDNLEAGKEYIFQYEVDGDVRIGDPYAEKVSDPWNDHYIDEATYPGLISYPHGLTSGIATVLQTAQASYQWQVENFEPPAPEEMIIYELLVRDFTHQHTFQALIDTIEYFKRLGVNVIELMPVNEFEGNISWGYNSNYYFAVDKYYGHQNKLKEFIDVCHDNGIAVVIDMVLNHAYGTNPMVLLYWDKDNNRPAENNPWFNTVCPHEPWCWGYDFDHQSPYTQEFVDRVNRFWLTEYKVDGFRFDFTKGFTNQQTGGQGWEYDAVRVGLLKRMADEIWEINPDAYVILEHFTHNNEEKELANYGMMLWGNMNHAYNEATMGWLNNSDFSWISHQQRGWNDPHVVGYMESHDEERLMVKNYLYGNSVPGYNTKNVDIALKRMALAANFFIPVPGPKMIWQFGEFGYDTSINYNGRTGPKPIMWHYLDDWRREYLFHVYSALIGLKKGYDVFKTDDFTLNASGANKSIILQHDEMDVIVLGNFGLTQTSTIPQWTQLGIWYEFYSQTELDVPHDNVNIALAPGEYQLLSTQKIEKPDWLNTSVEEFEFQLEHNDFHVFPNPSKGNFSFIIQSDQTRDINLVIYDNFGKTVADLSQKVESGVQTLTWDGSNNLKSGIYFAVFTCGSFINSQKLIIK